MLVDTERIDAAFEHLRGLTKLPPPDVGVRKDMLRRLRRTVIEAQAEIHEAMYADFRKSVTEVELTEIAALLLELKTTISELDSWASPVRVRAPFPFWSTKSYRTSQPKGLVLIMSPWNYPVLLSLAPLNSAIAAGNRVILKPSERIPKTSALLGRIVRRAFGDDWCAVIEGDADAGAYLLSKPFDHFFFTGSPAVGRKVMEAAAGHLSSVTLELGGKSPAIVEATADIELAVDKIIVGKFMNAGQTCIAPDYVIAHASRFDTVVDHLRRAVAKIHEVHQDGITGLVDDRHVGRLTSLWNEAHQIGASKGTGEEALDLSTVSVITGVSLSTRLMNEEIFGPLLPVVEYESIEDILGLVDQTGPPLTTYLFTRDEKFAKDIEQRLPTGSICRDETLLHFAHPELPFGGVGKSGTGRTHGRFGFHALSNEVSVLRSRRGLSVLPFLFPVKGSSEKRVRTWLMKWLDS